VVLLPGGGFGTTSPAGRVSLANLNEVDYRKIGRAARALIEEYHAKFLKETGEAKQS
jgi:aspartate 4-decarboxylase